MRFDRVQPKILDKFEPIESARDFEKKWDWVGCIVRTNTPFRNGRAVVPSGSYAVVKYQRSGAELEWRGCGECGVRMSMTKVPLDGLVPVCRAYESPPYPESLYIPNRDKMWDRFDEFLFARYEGYAPPRCPVPRRQELFSEMIRRFLDSSTLSMGDMLSSFETVAKAVSEEAARSLEHEGEE